VRSQDEILGLPEATDPSRYPMLSAEERAQLTPKRRAAYKQQERDTLIAEFRENNHAVEAIVPMEETLAGGGSAYEQLVANGMITTIDDPRYGTTTQVGLPIHLASTPGAIRGPRPEPGQHNEEIFGELGYSAREIAAFSSMREVA
jgi:crotonobetainyl-CoA:carnitine CoA-transferase CaiB-like acyl-CoA transferase